MGETALTFSGQEWHNGRNGVTAPCRRLLRRPTTADRERIARQCPPEGLSIPVIVDAIRRETGCSRATAYRAVTDAFADGTLAQTEGKDRETVDARLTPATGHAEREAALAMAPAIAGAHRVTLGADKGYDTRDFVASLRGLQVTPHVAQNTTNRSSAIDGRTTSHAGDGGSQQKRKLVE